MFVKSLSTFALRSSSGNVLASPRAAGARSRASGDARRTNGRIFSRTIGVASRANGLTAALTFSSSRTAGSSARVVGPSSSANGLTAFSVEVACCSVGCELARGVAQPGILGGDRAERRLRGAHEARQIARLVARAGG